MSVSVRDTAQAIQAKAPVAAKVFDTNYVLSRVSDVQKHFEGPITADDFLVLVEVALCGYGFTGETPLANKLPEAT